MCKKYLLNYKLAVISFYSRKYSTVTDTLKIFKISNGSLFNWINLFLSKRLNKIQKRKKYNSKLSNVIQYVITYVLKYKQVNCNRLISLIKLKYNKVISKSSIYKILKNNNISRKKVRTHVILHNKRKHNKLKKIFINKINKINNDNIISIDETSIDTHISSQYGWNLKGEHIFRTQNKQRIRYSVISSISNKKVIYNKTIKGSANKYIFLDFIKEVIKRTKIKNKYFLLDNARIHHAKIFKQFIENNNLNIIYNVPYSPENNPIERVFSIVKYLLRNKKNNNTALLKNINSCFMKVTHTQLHNFYKKSLTFD